jgi:nucleotide-binding universal stress UspA family protein
MQKRRHAKSLFSSVLCPVDFSNHSSAALRFAAAMARRARASLQVLYVNDPLLVAAAAAGYDESALGAASERELRRFVSSTVPAAATRQLHPTFVTALGKPAREIRRTVERSGHDLVVVGTKGLNGARRLLLGSTTSAARACRSSPFPRRMTGPVDPASARRGRAGPSSPRSSSGLEPSTMSEERLTSRGGSTPLSCWSTWSHYRRRPRGSRPTSRRSCARGAGRPSGRSTRREQPQAV